MSVKRVVVTGAAGALAQVVIPALNEAGYHVLPSIGRITDFYSAQDEFRYVPVGEPLHGLIHLAGAYEVEAPHPVVRLDDGYVLGEPGVFERMMTANYLSAVHAYRALQHELLLAQSPALVVISTNATGGEGWRNRAYIASKRALEGFAYSFFGSKVRPHVVQSGHLQYDWQRANVASDIVAHLNQG